MKSHSLRFRALPALLLAFAVGLAACSRPTTSGTARTSSYDPVLQAKTLRVAYISYPPSFIKDANTGAYSGIMHEVLQELAKRLDFRVSYVEETAWGTMIEAVNSGRVDLVCTGLWPNATRGKFVDFSDPVYFSPVRAYVKSGNKTFDSSLNAINAKDVKIATIDGEMTSIIAAADYPLAKAEAHPQSTDIAQMLLEVATGKAAVTFVETAVANGFLEKNPGMVEAVQGVMPVRVFPNVFMVAKGEGKLLSMLNIALEEASNTGTVDQILSKYDKPAGTFLRRQLPFRTAP